MEDNIRRMFEIKQYKDKETRFLTDIAIREISFDILINQRRITSISAIPEKLEELALGFIYTEGILYSREEILHTEMSYQDQYIHFELNVSQERMNAFLHGKNKSQACSAFLCSQITGCRFAFPNLSIQGDVLLDLVNSFQNRSVLFRETGGVHSAGVIRNDKIIAFASDIGRHNAVDKVTGELLKKEIPFHDSYLLTTGRITAEIVRKNIRAGYPMIISHSAPTSEAIRLGWEHKIFLIGFARGNRFNLYTGLNQLNIL